MCDLEKKILRFLIDGKAYSDEAIIKNFGISEEELKLIYENLLEEGYLETYASFEERQKSEREGMNENHCGTSCSSGSCGCKGEKDSQVEKKCCVEKDLDTSKILVLTEKALNS